MTDKIYITWNEFHQDVKNLCLKIKNSGQKFNKIVAVSRGGFIPAGIVAYELNIRNSAVINISTYFDDKHLELNEISNIQSIGKVDEKTLIIDDISDTGQTFKLMRQTFPKGTFATVYTKEKGLNQVDIFERQVPEKWLVFPWDI